jgi:gluconokinase
MFVILMGVAGSGKTTVGILLAKRLQCPFYDGDDFHPPANVTKMAAGTPLTDDDRAGWLAALAEVIRDGLGRGESGVVACSALKESYREVLRVDEAKVKFIYLKGSYEVILQRMQSRKHFMKPAMLQSQFASLEEPADVPWIDVTLDPDEIVRRIAEQIDDTPF